MIHKHFYSHSIFLLTFCFALICIPPLASAEDAVRQPVDLETANALHQLKTRSETPVRTRWHADRGTVRSLYNLTISVSAGTPEMTARQFLNDYRALFAMTDPKVDLRLKKLQSSLTGTHIRLHQYHKGIEVYGAEISVHINRSGKIRVVHNNYFPKINVNTTPSISPGEAINIATADANVRNLRKPPRAELVIYPNRSALQMGDLRNAYRLAYRATIHSRKPLAGWEYIIDANTGRVVHRRNLLKFVDGRGRVFNPNPVVALKNPELRDQDDSANAIPEAAYSDVILPELDGSGFLDGIFVSTELTPNRANEPTLEFNYLRDDPRFEEVMVYYHIDAVARYLNELGFDFVDGWRLPVNAHFDEEDNSFYDGESLNFGDGGVDDAEDAEVIIHEYGHAIQDRQVEGFGKRDEGGAMGEGFGDFLAASFYSTVSDGFGDTTIFDWVGTVDQGTRPLDSNKRYPDDIAGEVHDDGEIWSAALWELFTVIGRDPSIRLVIESHFLLSPEAEFEDGAVALLSTDQDLNDSANFDLILSIMENHGFLTRPTLANDSFEANNTTETAAAITLPFTGEELSIEAADDEDYYTFSLAETTQIGIGIDYLPVFGELMLTLIGPDGAKIITFETDDIASIQLDVGDYLVSVSSIDGETNDYTLALIVDEHGDTADTATPVDIGTTIESFIDFPGDMDFFSIEAEAGQVIEITVKTEDSDLNSLLAVYKPDGDLLASNDTAPVELTDTPEVDSFVSEKLPDDGTYWIVVSNLAAPNLNMPFGGVKFSYTLSISESSDVIGEGDDDHADCGSGEETPLVFDEPVPGVINTEGDFDGFSFEASEGDVIALTVVAEDDSPLEAILLLLDEAGEQLVSDNDTYLIPADGVYCVEISSFEGGGSDYTYTLTLSESERELPEDDHEDLRGNPTPLAVGIPIEGSIGFAGDVDAFQFTATAGQFITLDVNAEVDGSSLDGLLKLYDSNQESLAESDADAESLDPLLEGFEIPADATYFVTIEDFNGSGGADLTYVLTLTIQEGGEGDGETEFPAWDVNQDGVVSIFDLVLVGQHFGENFLNAGPTPFFGEPRSASPEGELRLIMTPSVTDTRQLTVSISTTAITDLYGYHLTLQYHPMVLELLTTSPSQALASDLPRNSNSTDLPYFWQMSHQGTQLDLTQTRQATPKGAVVDGLLATLVFNVKQGAQLTSQLPIQIVDFQLADSQARFIPVEIASSSVSMADLFPTQSMLLQNYPNPFNPETWLPYQISEDSDVTISIYDAKGGLVRQLNLGHQHVGSYVSHDKAAYWDGRDRHGQRVASGLYFYHLQTGNFSSVRRMVILK